MLGYVVAKTSVWWTRLNGGTFSDFEERSFLGTWPVIWASGRPYMYEQCSRMLEAQVGASQRSPATATTMQAVQDSWKGMGVSDMQVWCGFL